MNLALNGVDYDFVPVKEFRDAHQLPTDFGVVQFEVKDYTGLGRIDQAGTALNGVRAAVLAAISEQVPIREWLTTLPRLTRLFETHLQSINEQVGLKQVEIEYAVAGFNDSLQTYIYALLHASTAKTEPPPFHAVYHDWLNSTVRVYAHKHLCTLDGETGTAQVVAHAYGRVGLLIQTAAKSYAVYDPVFACPAEGFMTTLLADIAERMMGS